MKENTYTSDIPQLPENTLIWHDPVIKALRHFLVRGTKTKINIFWILHRHINNCDLLPISQSELSKKAKVTREYLSQIINKLSSAGILKKIRNPGKSFSYAFFEPIQGLEKQTLKLMTQNKYPKFILEELEELEDKKISISLGGSHV